MSQIITFSTSSGSGSILTITGNTGGAVSPTAGNINILTANTNIVFAGAVSTETLDFGATSNLLLGQTGAITSGTNNVSLGQLALSSVSTGIGNTCLGFGSGEIITGGHYNSGHGWNSLRSLVSGQDNTAVGVNSLYFLQTGQSNVCVGDNTGASYTSSEQGNICIGTQVVGIVGESNVMRLGLAQTKTFVAGISGVSVSNLNIVTIDTTTGQLGSQAPSSSATYFVAYLNAIQSAVTGDGTLYSIPFNATLVNVGSAFNTGTGAFTAPATGVYFFNVTMYVQSLTAAVYTIGFAQFDINAGTADYLFLDTNFSAMADANMNLIVNASQILSLTSGDVVKVQVGVIGGPKTVNVYGSATPSPTNFSGYRIA